MDHFRQGWRDKARKAKYIGAFILAPLENDIARNHDTQVNDFVIITTKYNACKKKLAFEHHKFLTVSLTWRFTNDFDQVDNKF